MDKPTHLVRHTIIADKDFALDNLQEKDWMYFVKRLIHVS